MKKLFFSFVMLVALVIVAGSAMAQSTWSAPYKGSTHSYTVGGLTGGDGYQFFLADPAAIGFPSASISGGTINNASGTLAAAATSVSTNILWTAAGNYRLWIRMQDNDPVNNGCYNWRYMDITVTDYSFELALTPLGTATSTTDASTLTTNATACPTFDGAIFLHSSASNGSTYAFFKVARTVTSMSSHSTWAFNPDLTLTGSPAITAWEYSYNGTSWTDITATIGDLFTTDNGTRNVVYFRAKVTNAPNSTYGLAIDIDSTVAPYEVNGGIKDTSPSDNQTSLTINQLPSVGGFTEN